MPEPLNEQHLAGGFGQDRNETDPAKVDKPVSEFRHSELVRLPELTPSRQRIRKLLNGLVRLLVRLFIWARVQGLENFPEKGPVLVVGNHLGDVDDLLKVAYFPRQMEAIAKIELYDIPLLGKLMDAYGVIWVRRGQPDRRALRAALQGLQEERVVMINPEGRESLSGALEEASNGAAFLAIKADAALLPVAITGSQNRNLYHNLLRFRRTHITFTIGSAFRLTPGATPKDSVQKGTQQIMQTLANMLPEAYRGVYIDRQTAPHQLAGQGKQNDNETPIRMENHQS